MRTQYGNALAILLLATAGLASCSSEPGTVGPAPAVTPLQLADGGDVAVSPATMTRSVPTVTATASATAMPPTPTTTPAPTPTVPTTVRVEAPGASLSSGFSMIRFADLYRPTGLAFGADGGLYATSFDGTVHLFVDDDGDGQADQDLVLARGFDTPLGVAVTEDGATLYVSSNSRITRLRDLDRDRVVDEIEPWVTGLPAGRHQNDNLKFGPDGLLYMGVGSTCDACREADPRSATIMRFNPDSGEGEVIATGLRNPYDLAFHPETGELFATDNGRDDLGMDAPLEELNRILIGGDYGWPGCWDRLQGPACNGTIPAVAYFAAHSSANSLDFYGSGPFVYPSPNVYTNNLFVAILGSWLKPGVETGIARVVLTPSGDDYDAAVSWFARWDGMPLGLVVGPDGALYVGDYVNDAVYRISYGLP